VQLDFHLPHQEKSMSRTRAKKAITVRFCRPVDANGRCMAIVTTGASIAFLAAVILAL
jgi:hypothetical protein